MFKIDILPAARRKPDKPFLHVFPGICGNGPAGKRPYLKGGKGFAGKKKCAKNAGD
jgi:hypothetical protein